MRQKEHLGHYLILVVVLSFSLWGFATQSGGSFSRFISLFGGVLGYVVWGIWHHFVEKRLSWFLISEYLLLALLILATASLILFPL